MGRLPSVQTPGTFSYAVMPAELADAGDLYQVNIGKFTETAERSAQVYFRAPDNRVVYLPPAFDSPAVAISAASPGLPTATWAPYPDAVYYRTEYIAYNTPGSGHTIWTVTASRDWQGARTGYTMPDLTALAGWQPVWSLPRVDWWRVTAVGSSRTYVEIAGMFSPATSALGDTPLSIAAKKATITARGWSASAVPPAPGIRASTEGIAGIP
jgi:hypothetical protein